MPAKKRQKLSDGAVAKNNADMENLQRQEVMQELATEVDGASITALSRAADQVRQD